ncbi:MAG: tetratricopeptide repeat protein [Nitrospinota bacterium]
MNRFALAVIVLSFFINVDLIFAAGKINNIQFTNLQDRSQLALILSDEIKFSSEHNVEGNIFRLTFENSLEAERILEDNKRWLDHKDSLIEAVTASYDEKSKVMVIEIKLAKQAVSIVKSISKKPNGLVFDFYSKDKIVKVPNITAKRFEQLFKDNLDKRNLEEVLANNRLDPKLQKLKQTGSIQSEQAIRSDYITLLKTIQDEDIPSIQKSIKLANKFLRKYSGTVYDEKVLYLIANSNYLLAKNDKRKLEDALQSIITATSNYPNSQFYRQAIMRKASIYSRQKLYLEALNEYSLLIKKFPNDKYVTEAMLGKALIHINNNELELANDDLVKILLLNPTYNDIKNILYLLGATFHARGNYQRAFEIFDDAQTRWPRYPVDNLAIYLAIADTFAKLGYQDKAEESFLNIINISPNSKEGQQAVLQLANHYLPIDQEKSIKLYKRLLVNDQSEEYTLAKLGLASIGATDQKLLLNEESFQIQPLARPLKTLDEIFKQDPELFGKEALIVKANALSANSEYLASIDTFKQVIEQYSLDQDSAKIKAKIRDNLIKLINSYYNQDGFFATLLTYHTNFDPFLMELTEPRLLAKIGDSYLKIGLYNKAVEYLQRATSMELSGKQRVDYDLILSESLIKIGQNQDALNILSPILVNNEDPKILIRARLLFADASYNRNEFKNAITSWQDILAKENDDKLTTKVAYKLALLYEKNNQLREALKNFQIVINRSIPEDETFKDQWNYIKNSRYKIAKIRYHLGDRDLLIDAANDYISRYETDPKSKWLKYIIAQTESDLQNSESAVSLLEELSNNESDELLSIVADSRLTALKWKGYNYLLFAD